MHHHVVAAIIVHEGHVLCMQRGQTKYAYTSYKWEFPGGKIEPGERAEDALHREIREEMDMDITVLRHLTTRHHTYPDFEVTLEFYLCLGGSRPDKSGMPAFTMREHHAFRWLPKGELHTLDWVEADLPVIQQIQQLAD
ncbi:MAG: (deoxy)nucleoside triphosphate pyrophosphohydrolase [Paludibacteraceae bacterium]